MRKEVEVAQRAEIIFHCEDMQHSNRGVIIMTVGRRNTILVFKRTKNIQY